MVDVDVVQGAFASVGAGAVTAVGWLTSKLWRLWRHEIADMKQAITNTSVGLNLMANRLIDHMSADEALQRTISSDLAEIKGYIKGRDGEPLRGT